MSEVLIWVTVALFLVALACSQVGTFLVMRRMSLMGDAISHSVLPGIVVAFLFTGSLGSPWLMLGAGLSGLAVTVIVELIHTRSRIKQDAAIGIAFTALFALGVLLIGLFAKRVDLDPDCVLYGQVEFVMNGAMVEWAGVMIPQAVLVLLGVALAVLVFVVVFYRVLMVCSFDAELASSYGYKPMVIHFLLMGMTSFVVVAAFQVVGAILVIALLIIPGAFGSLCAKRLPTVLILAGLHALLSTVGGVWMGFETEMGIASCVVMVGGGVFVLGWLFGPIDGVLMKWWLRMRGKDRLSIDNLGLKSPSESS